MSAPNVGRGGMSFTMNALSAGVAAVIPEKDACVVAASLPPLLPAAPAAKAPHPPHKHPPPPPHTHTRTPQEEAEAGACVGLDVGSGEPADPHLGGIFDNYTVKRQILQR